MSKHHCGATQHNLRHKQIHTPLSPTGGRPRTQIVVGNINLHTLIDTGSTHTLLDAHTYSKLPHTSPLIAAPSLQSITGHPLPLIGSTTIELCGERHSVLVCQKLGTDLLLGADVCKTAIIDFKNKKINLHGIKLDLNTTPETHSCHSTTGLPATTDTELNKILQEYADVFSPKEKKLEISPHLPTAHLDTGDHLPIKSNPYRMPFSKREIVEQELESMLKQGVIRPSHSPWASPITLVPKKDGSTRFCVDYRKLNQILNTTAYPLPHTRDVLDQLQGAVLFSALDLKSGYWQLPMDPESISKTAFTCHKGLYEFIALPFGLASAPGIFQKAMNEVLSDLIGTCCMIYIDDIVVYGRSIQEHHVNLTRVLARLRQHGLQLKPTKCDMAKDSIELLGFQVSAEGLRPLPSRVADLLKLTPPTDKTGVRSFLGMTGYYRNLLPQYSKMALPLTNLTGAKAHFYWGPDQQKAFDQLKQALAHDPVTAHPDPRKPYTLYTDASHYCIGGVLCQRDDQGRERVIQYVSQKLSGAQLNWAVIEKEAWAALYCLKKLHVYTWGAKVTLKVDHQPLKSLFLAEVKNSKLQRWSIQLAEYGCKIEYVKGADNVCADAMSRMQYSPEGATAMICADTLANMSYVSPVLQVNATTMVDPPVQLPDGLSYSEVQKQQQEQFPDLLEQASQDMDDCSYEMIQGLLYSVMPPFQHATVYPRLVLPHQHREKVINQCHQESGHSAFLKTMLRVQEAYVWPGMRKHIKGYVSNCTTCNALTPPHQSPVKGKLSTPLYPFHTWHIDLVGAFPADRRGRKYLLTCVDSLTGYAQAVPISSKKNATVWHELAALFATHGIPHTLISDNGGEFVQQDFEKWLKNQGIQHNLTSAYHPQSNGKVERFNGTIQAILLKLTGGNPKKWSKHLPEALLAYNTNPSQTNLTPFEAVFGRKPRIPSSDTPDQGERLEVLHKAWRIFKEQQEGMKDKYVNTQKPSAQEMKVGDFVVVKALQPRKGQPKWETGYQVLTNHQGGLRVERLSDGRILRLNQSDARPLPPAKPYEEVNPVDTTPQLSKGQTTGQADLPKEAKALPPGTYALAPSQYPSVLEWNCWLGVVTETTTLTQ